MPAGVGDTAPLDTLTGWLAEPLLALLEPLEDAEALLGTQPGLSEMIWPFEARCQRAVQ
jgi:hypothetical protein